MSEELQPGVTHARAICPECSMLNVTVQTAPLRPPRMYCTDCQWNSLDGEVRWP